MKNTTIILSFILIFFGCGKKNTQSTNLTQPLSALQDFTSKNEVVADCYFGEPGNSKNATKFTIVKGGKNAGYTAITSTSNGVFISTHYVNGGFTKSALGFPLGVFTESTVGKPYPYYPYTISISVWPKNVATGEIETKPLAHGMENHKDLITCPFVAVTP